MKISKSIIIYYIIIGTIFCTDIFFLSPIIEENYDYRDISDFKNNSWKYLLIISFIGFTIYALKKGTLNKKYLLNNLFIIIFIGFFGKGIIDNLLLYLNLKVGKTEYSKQYVVFRDDEKKIFSLYDHEGNFRIFEEELTQIDYSRTTKKQKSIYTFKNKDTLNIDYKIGILGVKYLE